jgi:hypothetical protein
MPLLHDMPAHLLSREVNDRIARLNDDSPSGEFICECGSNSCLAPITLSTREYERIRRRPDTFLVAPGHWSQKYDRVVYETERYQLVQTKPADRGHLLPQAQGSRNPSESSVGPSAKNSRPTAPA